MWDMIRAMPGQLRLAATWQIGRPTEAGAAVVVGMGGSGVAGDLASALASDRMVIAHKDYGLPVWVAQVRPLVIIVSYSGNTAEALSGAEQCIRLGLAPVTITAGGRLADMAAAQGWTNLAVPPGFQPRAAVGWLVGAVVSVLGAYGILPAVTPDLEEAAEVVESLLQPESEAMARAGDIAAAIGQRWLGIYAAEPFVAVARRWKTQINENAKRPAFWGAVPELNHNELMGWVGNRSDRPALVMLRDGGESSSLSRRMELTGAFSDSGADVVGQVYSEGSSLLARMMSLVAVGDAVSVLVAQQAGVDPVAVSELEAFKSRLA